MNQLNESGTFVSSIMKAVGLKSRRKQKPTSARYLGMSGAFGRGEIRHCSTWDFEYKLPRTGLER